MARLLLHPCLHTHDRALGRLSVHPAQVGASDIIVTQAYEYGAYCEGAPTTGEKQCVRQGSENVTLPGCPAGTWFTVGVTMSVAHGVAAYVSCDGNTQSYNGTMPVPRQLWQDVGQLVSAAPYAVLGMEGCKGNWGNPRPTVRLFWHVLARALHWCSVCNARFDVIQSTLCTSSGSSCGRRRCESIAGNASVAAMLGHRHARNSSSHPSLCTISLLPQCLDTGASRMAPCRGCWLRPPEHAVPHSHSHALLACSSGAR